MIVKIPATIVVRGRDARLRTGCPVMPKRDRDPSSSGLAVNYFRRGRTKRAAGLLQSPSNLNDRAKWVSNNSQN